MLHRMLEWTVSDTDHNSVLFIERELRVLKG